jgi:hypothetical protein
LTFIRLGWWCKNAKLHIATSAVHGMQYLLTGNCTHLANSVLRARIERVCRAAGYDPPLICTPEELPTEGVKNG